MRLTGVLAPLPTPFDESGALDVPRLRAALPRWLASPLTDFVVLGTNGEAGLLNEREADTVIAGTRAGVPAGRPLLVGTARESTREAIAATGVNLLPDTVGRLAAHSNIVGITESGSDIAQIADLVAVATPGFTVLAGSASTLQAALSAGVSGAILALGGVLREACVRLFTLMRDGKHQEARLLQRQLLPLAPAPDSAVDARRAALLAFEDVFA